MNLLKSILKHWAVIAFVITGLCSVVIYAFSFGAYSAEFQNQLDIQEVKVEMLAFKQEVHSKQINDMEKNEAAQGEINLKIMEKLSDQKDSLTRIENLLLK